jgi:hypothetical protein
VPGSQQEKIRALDPGQARWDDVARLASKYLDAAPVDGYEALRFVHSGDEVVDASEAAAVLRIDGEDRAVGDYGGIPITGPRGARATLLGLNTEPLRSLLERFAFADSPAGAAHVRWPDRVPVPPGFENRPFALLFYAKQTLRLAGGDPTQMSVFLQAYAVDAERSVELDPEARGHAVRALLDATVRQKPEDAADLVARVRAVDAGLRTELRRPDEVELEHQLRHVVYPLLAAVVAQSNHGYTRLVPRGRIRGFQKMIRRRYRR